MDWRLSFFRFGMLACIVLAIFIVTQFDIVNSAVAIWNHNPTSREVAIANETVVARRTACLSAETKATKIEYPSRCYSSDPPFRGLPREIAIENVEGFLITGLALLVAMLSVVFMGTRMARESRI